jgi:hypothetical protein
VFAVAALLGVQALAAVPASAILTDGCAGETSCNEAGGDGPSSPSEADPSVDGFDSSSAPDASAEDQIDPLEHVDLLKDDDDEWASPLTDTPSPFFDHNPMYGWPGTGPMCDSLGLNIAKGQNFLYHVRASVKALTRNIKRLDSNFMRLDAAHPDAASIKRQVEDLRDQARDLAARFDDKVEKVEGYEDSYLKMGCNPIYVY